MFGKSKSCFTTLPLVLTRECQHLEFLSWHNFLQNLTEYIKKQFDNIRQWPAQNSDHYEKEHRSWALPLSRLSSWRQFSVCDIGKNMKCSLSWGDKYLSSRRLKGLEYSQTKSIEEGAMQRKHFRNLHRVTSESYMPIYRYIDQKFMRLGKNVQREKK